MQPHKFNELPQDVAQCITRLHHRMQQWRKDNPTAEVQIFHRGDDKLVVICKVRDAMKLGFMHVNAPGWEMIKAMCAPEKQEPTYNMVRLAIELNV